jgi:hypothetical protein
MIKNLKERVRKFKDSGNIFERYIYILLNILKISVLLLTNARLRAELFAKWRKKSNHYQISTYTISDRYPLIFKECSNYLKQIESPQIISFGCSTGEEVRTIGKYIPNAIIYGIDINKWCIKQCIKQNITATHFFYHRTSKEFETLQNVDAIFCMAVFQKTDDRIPGKKTDNKFFTFQSFEKEIILLDYKLKKDGLLIIDFSDFNFTDTVVSKKYVPLDFAKNRLLRRSPLFDKNNKKVADEKYLYRVFVKQLE